MSSADALACHVVSETHMDLLDELQELLEPHRAVDQMIVLELAASILALRMGGLAEARLVAEGFHRHVLQLIHEMPE